MKEENTSGTQTTEVSGYMDGWEQLEYLRKQGYTEKEIAKLIIEPPKLEEIHE